jgi:hypothetical protein
LSHEPWSSNLRWFCIVLGVLCRDIGLMNQHVLKERMKIATDARSKATRYPQLSAQAPTGRNEIARGKALRRPGSMCS